MPTTDDYGQGVNIASLTDAPDASKLAKDLANAIAQRSLMRFASASARGATLTAPIEGMPSWLEDVNRLEIYNGSSWVTPEPSLVSGTTGLSASSGFSLNDFTGYRQGRMTVLDIYLTRTGATINATNGNIVDTVCCVVPASWRPTHDTITGCYDTGIVHGGFVLGVDGIVTLRTASNDLANNTNLRLHIAFLRTTF
ncbi:hypothetical protein [Streptomyces resistomycificus]|uniref:hypothetical protein n=1 Tax=Streptomyces resistomycificus TaxID=67356 RepID=UPI0006903EB1|nr:hypothetical protein [Streptomyces resistomycificus]KUN99478.1 hypothetical protein AQJ84_11055 [Streptomyces resistomycificus]